MPTSKARSEATIAFHGTNALGRPESGFVRADSNQKALKALQERGITDVRLYGDSSCGAMRPELEKLSTQELAQLAEFEMQSMKEPSRRVYLRQTLQTYRAPLIAGTLVFSAAAVAGSATGMLSGAVIGLSMPLFSLYAYRASARYDKGVKAWNTGDWEQALVHFNWLLARYDERKMPEMVLDLTSRMAQIPTLFSEPEDALTLIEARRDLYKKHLPAGYYQARASVLLAAGDSGAFLRELKQLESLNDDSPVTRLDIALAEARFGTPAAAQERLRDIDPALLPDPCRPGYHWLEGEIALNNNRFGDAAHYLSEAVNGFLDYRNNPVMWPVLASCTGALALALAHTNEHEKAETLLSQVQHVLRIHGDPVLQAKLKLKFPGLLADNRAESQQESADITDD
ncbi:hypothetical protein Q4485_01185 [Granulosicoccaceae sp. 1_MG-2023]|nr:hypothetical protein [Granulosicoccaceae sp. 1_MG-2023]